MGAADKRVAELLERWLTSLKLHESYLDLDNDAYARAQVWPPHQRPTRWIIDLAKSRTLELKQLFDERQAKGDDGFATALELMCFLSTLVGVEHVERFVPQAHPPKSAPSPAKSAAPAARAPAPPARVIPAASARGRGDTTEVRTLPTSGRTSATSTSRARATPSARTQNTGTQRTVAARGNGAAARGEAASRGAGSRTGSTATRLNEKLVNQVVTDAVRMLDWGREWPQLAGLISRLADRPSEKEVWRILKEHKKTIESRANPPAD